MKIGITGHQRLEGVSWDWTRGEIRQLINGSDKPVIGISSLAIGADQIFAEEILSGGHTLQVVLPFSDIERTFKTEEDKKSFRSLLAQANEVVALDKQTNDETAFFKAGQKIVEIVDALIAVWDQKPAKGLGGTADIVQLSLDQNKPTTILNPYTQKVSFKN